MAGEQVILGATDWKLRRTLVSFDAATGLSFVQTWNGPYSTMMDCFNYLYNLSPRPKKITPNVSGAVGELVAELIPRTNGVPGIGLSDPACGGSGVASGAMLSDLWEANPVELPKAIGTHPAFAGTNWEKWKVRIDAEIVQGDKGSTDYVALAAADGDTLPNLNLYRDMKSQNVEEYLTDRYDVTNTQTFENTDLASAAAAAANETVGCVVGWASFGASSLLTEPKYAGISFEQGVAVIGQPVPYEYLVRAPRIVRTGKVWTMQRTWNGSTKWSRTLYPGGSGVP